MIESLRKRVAREESGFTLIELLVVIIILGILLAIAVPSYLSFKDRANRTAAQSDVRAVLPDVEQYSADNAGYAGMTLAGLKTYDASIGAPVHVAGDTADTGQISGIGSTTAPTASTYCVYAKVGNWYGWKLNPDGAVHYDNAVANVCTDTVSSAGA